MASPNFAKKNPFMGMTVAQMKTYYDKKIRGKGLKAKDLKVVADQMQAAKKAAPKAAPKAEPKAEPKSTQANTGTGRDGKFGSGTHGSGRPSDKPAVKTKRHRGGQRTNPGNRAAIKARQEERRQGAREVSNRARLANPGVSLPMRPAKNPSKGHRYKKPFGPIMVYDGTKYVRAK